MMSIALHPRGHAVVDEADYTTQSQHRWWLHPNGYAFRVEYSGGRRRTVYLHREIISARLGQETDHVNRDKLDNRRSTRYDAVEDFRAWLAGELNDTIGVPPTTGEIRRALRGKNLACWCKLDTPCHADVLLDIANA